MIKDLFDTDEKKQAAAIAFGELEHTAGWKLIEAILDQHIEYQRLKLENEQENETLEEIKNARKLLRLYGWFKTLPSRERHALESKDVEEESLDPFHNAETLIKQREQE